jgi:hypothetical protein
MVKEIFPQRAMDPDKWCYGESRSPVIPDPTAPAGYRLIVTVQYWKQVVSKEPGDHGFTIVPKGGVQN